MYEAIIIILSGFSQ